MKTSHDKADDLLIYSSKVYPAIDREVQAESNSRRITRLGIQSIAITLERACSDTYVAGDALHALLWNELQNGGISLSDLSAWPKYQSTIRKLPRSDIPDITDAELDILACRYADVQRATVCRNGEYETDASHAIHVMSLALPFAAEYHLNLNQSKIAIYCLIHDLVEAYAGDTETLRADKAALDDKAAREAVALRRITNELIGRYPGFVSLLHDYEKMLDDEARYVKTFDKLDPIFTFGYSKGISLTRDYNMPREEYIDLSLIHRKKIAASYGKDFSELLGVYKALTERTADEIQWQ